MIIGPSKLICKERRHVRPQIGKVACDTDVAGVRTAAYIFAVASFPDNIACP